MTAETYKAVSGGCPSSKAACLCRFGEGHTGPHRCVCDGAWTDDGGIVAFPHGITDPVEAMMSLLGFADEEPA